VKLPITLMAGHTELGKANQASDDGSPTEDASLNQRP
jgi:hypothetical protein